MIDDEQNTGIFDYDQMKTEFGEMIKNLSIKRGTVLESQIHFLTWASDPIIPCQFDAGLLFTVIDIQYKAEEYVLLCYRDDKIVEIDAFLLFLNSKSLHMDLTLEEVFSNFFIKII